MRRKWIGGIAAALAGAGIVAYLRSSQDDETGPQEQWTSVEMPDLTGKVVVVTGANSGVGFEAAKEFARAGAETILACRNLEKAQAALDEIQAEIPSAQVEIMHLDLASLGSVRDFAEEFHAEYDRLDILVNNAGIMMVDYGTTEDGFERQFGTNHLGHFALTGLLFDLLLDTPGARVVTVSSNAHQMGDMDFDNLMYAQGRGYSPLRAYGRSKLANLLFTAELQRRFEALDADAIATAAHPGSSSTNLGNHLREHWYMRLAGPLLERWNQSAAMGALPILRAAVDPVADGGDYYSPDGFMGQRGYPVKVQASAAAYDGADARTLWQVSEALTGVQYEEMQKEPA